MIKTYSFFDEQKLRNELHTLYNRLFHKPQGDLIQLLIEDDLQGTLSEVYKLLQLMLTIPATSTSAECSFSCLKRIKSYLRNTCGQDRLVNLAKISIDTVIYINVYIKSMCHLENVVCDCYIVLIIIMMILYYIFIA